MYSLLVKIAVVLSVLLYCIPAILPYLCSFFIPKKKSAHLMRIITLNLGRTVIWLGFRPFVKITYQDEVTGAHPAGIYVCNHRAATDAFLVALFGEEAIQIVNGWPMKLPLVGFNAKRNGYIDSTQTSPEQYETIFSNLLKQGVSIITFPEGTRSGSRQMNPFHSGIFHLAMKLKAPIYPCCIAGNEHFPDKKFHFFKTKQIFVKRLKPIMPEEYDKLPSAYVLKKRIHAIIKQQCDLLDI